MIEIKLTGEQAQAYLEEQTPDVQTLANSLRTATEYIDVLESQIKRLQADKGVILGEMSKDAAPSSRVLRDTETVNELQPLVAKGDHIVPNPPMTEGRWTQSEIDLIGWCMARPEAELNRSFKNMLEKLNRSEASVRSKLAELNIVVQTGIMYYK